MLSTSVYFENSCHGDDSFVRMRYNGMVLVGVFDGVSAAEGRIASQYCADLLSATQPKTPEELVQRLLEAHEYLKQEYHGEAQTTASVALISDRLFVCTVGDSPIIQCTKDSCTKATPLDAVKNEPNVLTQAIGVDSVTIHTTYLEPKGRVVIMTDGISDNLEFEEIAQVIKGSTNANQTKQRLEAVLQQRALEDRGFIYPEFKDDDRTAVVVMFKGW